MHQYNQQSIVKESIAVNFQFNKEPFEGIALVDAHFDQVR